MIELDTAFGDGTAVIRPIGRLTMDTAPKLRSLVRQAVAENRARVVIDLSGIESMDSVGLGSLIAGLKTTRQAGGDLRIACIGPQVSTILHLASLERVLRPYDSVAEALQ